MGASHNDRSVSNVERVTAAGVDKQLLRQPADIIYKVVLASFLSVPLISSHLRPLFPPVTNDWNSLPKDVVDI